MISGLYKYIVFDPIERSTGKVYDEPCHRVLGHARRPAEHRLGRREPLVRAALLPAGRAALRSGVGSEGARHRRRRLHRLARRRPAASPTATSRVIFDLVAVAATTRRREVETVLGDSADRGRRAARGPRLRRDHPPRRGRRRQRGRRATRSAPTAINVARHADDARGGAARRRSRRVVYGEHGLGLRQRAGRRAARRGHAARAAGAPLHGDEARRRDVLPLVRRRSTALEHTILRFGIPYGPRARPAAVVPAFVAKAQARQGADDRRRRPADAPVRLRRGPRRGRRRRRSRRRRRTASTTSSATSDVSVRQIADTVRELVADVPIVHGPERPADVAHRRASPASARRRELGWRPQTAFARRRRAATSTGCAVTNGSPVAATAVEHRRQRRGRPAPGAGRAVVVGVVQQHDVAGAEVARRARRDRRRASRCAPSRGPSATRGAATSRAAGRGAAPARLKTPYGGR